MRNAYAATTFRAAEKSLMGTLPDGALMQRAASGLARRCAAVLGSVYGARVVLLVGTGDNGGDALFAGARLAGRGARVDAVLLGERHHVEGARALRRAGGRLLPAEAADGDVLEAVLEGADLVVDGVTGIGGRGGLRGRAAEIASRLSADHSTDARALVIAVDVPSGVDADTGEVEGVAVAADITVTFGALKPGLLIDPGRTHAGVVELVDIGLEPHLPSEADVAHFEAQDADNAVPRPAAGAHKYTRGVVGVAAGSDDYAGAAVLAVGGALAAGAGMVRFVGEPKVSDVVRAHWPEAVVEPGTGGAAGVASAGRVQCWVVGPGLGAVAREVLSVVLASDLPVVVDADAIAPLAELGGRAGVLVTPHAGELAGALGVDRDEVEARRLHWVRAAAERWQCAVLLKGATTLVADASGSVVVTSTAPPWTATAGAGDVLAGACGALAASGLAPQTAGATGAFLHGLSAAIAADGDAPIRAGELTARWGDAVRAVRD